jgi:hypothetical protein
MPTAVGNEWRSIAKLPNLPTFAVEIRLIYSISKQKLSS